MPEKIIKAWGGFSEDSLMCEPDMDIYDEPRYAIFPTRRAAKRAYADVRKIEIRVSE